MADDVPIFWQVIVEESGLAFSTERIILYHAYKPVHRAQAEEHTLLVESPRSRKKRASLGDLGIGQE